MNKIKIFESFAGYGSQSISLRDMGIDHEVIGISEIEPDAIIAYGAIRYNLDELHTDKTHDEMRKELMAKNVGWDFQKQKSKIPRMKKDKLEMLYKFDKVINNFGDISIINPNDLPNFDYFTYSFPCQSVSCAGKQEGIIKGKTRSGLLYECEKIIETKKPKYLLMENVKALVSKKFRNNFNGWLEYLESLGYKNYWKVLNAKNYGIAQNRDRVFCVSILDDVTYEFPDGFKLEKRLKDFLDNSIEDKYYLNKSWHFTKDDELKHDTNEIAQIDNINYKATRSISDINKMCRTIDTMCGGQREPKILEHNTICEQRCDEGLRFFKDNVCGTIRTINSGGDKRVIETEPSFRIRKLTPRECLRLMGLSDEDIDKIRSTGLSDSSLYKLAGNSIVKQCLDYIHMNMFKDNICKNQTPSEE